MIGYVLHKEDGDPYCIAVDYNKAIEISRAMGTDVIRRVDFDTHEWSRDRIVNIIRFNPDTESWDWEDLL